MREQLLDTMDLERERGITIKLNAVRMSYTARGRRRVRAQPDRHARPRGLHLRGVALAGRLRGRHPRGGRLAGHPGADAVATSSSRMDAGLEIIPVLNKIDLPGAEPEQRAQEIMDLIGAKREEILAVSAKEGTGIPDLLEAIVRRVPPPRGTSRGAAPRADLRLVLRPVPRRHPQHPGGGRRAARAGCRSPSAPTRTTSTRWTRSATSQLGQHPTDELDGGRGGLPRGEPPRRARRPRGRHRLRRRPTAPPSCCPATATSSRWCSPASTPPTPTSTRTSATRWRSSSSTTPRCTTSRSRPPRSASASAAASSACCTWRSCRSGWSASSTST